MPRIFLTVNEGNPNVPKVELHVNGSVFGLSERELQSLAEEVKWVQGVISERRLQAWRALAVKYEGGGGHAKAAG